MSPFVISKTFEVKLDYNCCALIMTFDNIECLFLLRSFLETFYNRSLFFVQWYLVKQEDSSRINLSHSPIIYFAVFLRNDFNNSASIFALLKNICSPTYQKVFR